MFLIRQKWTSPAWHSSTGVYVWVEVVVISLMTHLTGHPAGPRVPPVLDGRRGCGFLRKRRSGSSASVIVTARYVRLPPLLPVISLCRLLRKLPGDAASLECRRVAAVPCGAGRWPCASGRLHHTGMSPRWARLSGVERLWRACLRSAPCQAGTPGQVGRGSDPESVRPKSREPPWGTKRSWAWKQNWAASPVGAA